jgi:hypothetical protein
MAETYGTIALSNGQTIGVAYATSAPAGSLLKVEPSGAAVATSNSIFFMVRSPCRIVDWVSPTITSGKMELLSDGHATGRMCNVQNIDIALIRRVFPAVGLRPGVKYSILVTETFVD